MDEYLRFYPGTFKTNNVAIYYVYLEAAGVTTRGIYMRVHVLGCHTASSIQTIFYFVICIVCVLC